MEQLVHFGVWSIVPSLVTICMAIFTKRVFLSLLLGVFCGMMIFAHGDLVLGFSLTIDKVADVFKSSGNTKTILFTLTIGGLLQLMRYSGGVNGFVYKATQFFKEGQPKSKQRIQYFALVSGAVLFIESNISILTTSTLFRPLFDKFRISRERLAYIADSGAAPFSILIPFNAWGAFVISLLAAEGLSEQGLHLLVYSIGVNFYPIVALLVLFGTILFSRDIGAMKQARAVECQQVATVERGNMWNMLVPLAVLVLTTPIFLIYTGWVPQAGVGFWSNVYGAIARGSGASAVLYAVVLSVIVLMVMMAFQNRKAGISSELTRGVLDMVGAAMIMMMAFAIGAVCRDLETGRYVSQVVGDLIPRWLLPAVVFIVGSLVAFSTGTSWGTFSIMMPIAIPLAQEAGIPLVLAVSAVLGGGVFGDHCSPISDTSVLSSTASGCPHMAHVNTQLPYALISGCIAIVCYIVAMVIM